MSDFEAKLKNLNPDQQAAVSFIEGPLLVIAGPGTGKTQLLSFRAANILTKTDTLPENILCLTFTESGASEMRRRLIEIIGEDAYKITVSTYHSFGSEIIQANSSLIGADQNLRPIDDLKADIIIRDIQKTLKYDSDFNYENAVRKIRRLISDAKRATLTPQDLQLVVKANTEFITLTNKVIRPLSANLSPVSKKAVPYYQKLVLPKLKASTLPNNVEPLMTLWNNELEAALADFNETNKTKNITAWKNKYLQRNGNDLFTAVGKNQAHKLNQLANIYDQYQQELISKGLYDYDDMIIKAINSLKSNDELRFNLQEKYLYIMLDEYQDTNKAQSELVEQLTNNKANEGKPNVMAVGDDDQAIYAFQGAKHSNMLDFVNSYQDVKVITLKTNYRSTQDIIDLSTQTSAQIKSRVTKLLKNVSKDFQPYFKNSGRIRSLSFNNEIDEYSWLANDIKGSKEGSIAIIAPEHKYLERASAYLLAKDIPISYERRENILDEPKVNEIITLMRLLVAIADHNDSLTDSLLAKVLNYDFWQLPAQDIWLLSWQAHEKRAPWLKLMLKNSKLKTVALMLLKLAANGISYRYDFILDQLIGLSDVKLNEPQQVATRSPFLHYYSKAGDLTVSRLFENLITLKQKFTEFNGDNQKPLMITDLIEYIDQLLLSDEKVVGELKYVQNNAKVELISAHGAKGREFDSVYLISFINEAWGPKTDKGKLSLPTNLEYIRQRADDPDDERLRLLYVALSRAKTKLTTLKYDKSYEGKETTPIKYLDQQLTLVKLTTPSDLIPLWRQAERQLEIPSDLKETIRRRIENYALSATDLRTFIDVTRAGPRALYDKAFLKYKTYTTTHMDYGNAIHASVDWLQTKLTLNSKLPTLDALIDQYVANLDKHRLMPHDYSRLKDQGIDALTSFYALNKADLSKLDKSEYDFRGEGEVINGHRITGTVDKLIIDKHNKQLEIIDYKTGKGATGWTSEAKMYLYRNQLYFYKLLVENSSAFRGYRIQGARLDFILPSLTESSKYRIPLEYDKQLEDRLIKLIDAVWLHINELNFPSVSSYKENIRGIIEFEDDLIAGKI